MGFRLRFWGTRGSIPAPGPRTVRYGGNTPCMEARSEGGGFIILDAGSGLRELGRHLLTRPGQKTTPIDAHLFCTHTHWDHIQGFPFFAPLFRPQNAFTVWVPGKPVKGLEKALRAQMRAPVFPVAFSQIQAKLEFRACDMHAAADDWEADAILVHHPGGALGYRFRTAGAETPAFVYVSDNELDADPRLSKHVFERLAEFTRGARVLVHDASYLASEYEAHRGWGHSTDGAAVRLAIEAGVETLVLYHHAPFRSDLELDATLDRCRREAAGRIEVLAAAEGMQVRC
jgi:phosphoribosyl 1,2-cyclic phosphodiesterase